jgi:hypothetical protein
VVFVIPNEKDREKVKEYCGEDSHIVSITTPGQVCYSPISAHSLWNVYLAHAILDLPVAPIRLRSNCVKVIM